MTLLLDAAGFDVVIVETVGVGQDEVEIARLAEVTVVVLTPAWATMCRRSKRVSWRSPTCSSSTKRICRERKNWSSEFKASLALAHRATAGFPRWSRTIASEGKASRKCSHAAEDAGRAKRDHRRPRRSSDASRKLRIDHLGIAVRSIEQALRFYQEQLGLAVARGKPWRRKKCTVAMLPLEGSRIELLEPTEPDSPVGKFLEKRGEGLHHVALKVPDLNAAVERLRASGARLLNEPRAGAGGHLYVFVHPASTGGVLLELIQAMKPKIGIIGGSGLYSMPGFEAQEERLVGTPFGAPSEIMWSGKLAGKEVAFLARHGRGHRISPSELNFRANIWGMKIAGRGAHSFAQRGGLAQGGTQAARFRHSGSVRRSHARARLDVFRRRPGGAHQLRASHLPAAGAGGACAPRRRPAFNAKLGGTYLCMEGPAFSTLAESNLYRSWGMDVIGMTNLQEAKLAREAEICYVTIAMVTDYDCWHPDHDAVTVNDIIANPDARTRRTPRSWSPRRCAPCPTQRECKCGSALAHALITDRKAIPEATRKKLELLVGKYL